MLSQKITRQRKLNHSWKACRRNNADIAKCLASNFKYAESGKRRLNSNESSPRLVNVNKNKNWCDKECRWNLKWCLCKNSIDKRSTASIWKWCQTTKSLCIKKNRSNSKRRWWMNKRKSINYCKRSGIKKDPFLMMKFRNIWKGTNNCWNSTNLSENSNES
jgi:hypothetical protein